MSRSRTAILAALALVAGASGTALAVVPGDAGIAAAPCTVDYKVQNDWGSGFTADVTVTNTSTAAVNGWTLAFAFTGNQRVTSAWNATVTQSGTAVTARNLTYNAVLAPGASTAFGFQGTYSGANPAPTSFTLNGVTCA